MKYLLVVVSLVGLLVALGVRSASAQVATPAPVTSVDVLVLPAVGDPVVTAPLATRNTILTLASALCNQASLPVPGASLTNPTIAEVPDPFTAGRFCRAAIPTGLASATALRLVAVFNSAAGPSGRSPVGDLPFAIAPILVPPAAPASVGVRP